MNNIKDTFSTIAGVMGAIGAAIIALPTQGIVVPTWLLALGGVFVAVSVVVIGYFNGKTAEGKTKSPELLIDQKSKQEGR